MRYKQAEVIIIGNNRLLFIVMYLCYHYIRRYAYGYKGHNI